MPRGRTALLLIFGTTLLPSSGHTFENVTELRAACFRFYFTQRLTHDERIALKI